MKLTKKQRRELNIIGDKRQFARGHADNLRVAKSLERKGLVELRREWTERHPSMGKGPDYTVRVYSLTALGLAALTSKEGEDHG
ncbi:hypothetical protein [Jiella avicenniae]|uniref:Uncharacterized protein n=1 Tax=Jiella avicenniae TaxID=2907202 RepID=A0A9X1NZD0_9HYPH|nr:hypothetical protein [Jiella avicenniae]MCE7028432.1 hypothetical protein [Jiella avicenniae]